MSDKLKGVIVTVVAIAAVGAAGGAIAGATGGGHGPKNANRGDRPGERGEKRGDRETPITGGALAKAGQIALGQTGGGQVTDTEVGDEEGYYEVEVTRADGSQVDVHLDRDFHVIDASADREGPDDK